MLAKRIIPCLDIKDGQTVKGVNFENLRSAGDAVELACQYAKQGADELVFLDITATVEKRKTLISLVGKVAKQLDIPFTVGGGISQIADVEALLEAGADKISINSSAVKEPTLIEDLAKRFGSQCVVLAIDTHIFEEEWWVYVQGGRTRTTRKLFDWVREGEERGAGELLLTSMPHDGTKKGFACELTAQISDLVQIPIIASGGAGKVQDFQEVFTAGKADAALAASVFHFGEIAIPHLKETLRKQGIACR
jgi:imidazole glycerol-phosphate synthase subunit HisF